MGNILANDGSNENQQHAWPFFCAISARDGEIYSAPLAINLFPFLALHKKATHVPF
jgi:hypothetical protein